MQTAMFILLSLFLHGAHGLKIPPDVTTEPSLELLDLSKYTQGAEFENLVQRITSFGTHWSNVSASIDINDLIKAENQFTNGSTVHVEHETKEGHVENIGGDRMTTHKYAWLYAKHLTRLHDRNPSLEPTIAEVGILACTGVAMWSNIYPNSRIFGFDWDTTPCKNNWDSLKGKGFKDAHVTVHNLDQMQHNEAKIRDILGTNYTGKLNIVIDDGCHTPECNKKTFESFYPLLHDHFAYFIEDVLFGRTYKRQYREVWKMVRKICPDCRFERQGQLYVWYK